MDFKTEIYGFYVSLIICVIYLPHSVQSASLILYHTSLDNTTEVPLEQAEQLMPQLNIDLLTVIYTFGYQGETNGTATETFISTYLSVGNNNVILLNWTEEASNPYTSNLVGYTTHAAPNTINVGESLGLAIVKLVNLGLQESKIHLVGLSLGAHTMGYAGRKAKAEGVVVYRATGLDPAGLYFDPPLGYTPINQDSAAFVDCLHTDIGHCGMRHGSGHVDFFFNYGNYDSLIDSNAQPGCDPGFELCGNLCSHNRSVYYWAEALKFLKNFLAGKADSYEEYVRANGEFNITAYVGLLCNTRLTSGQVTGLNKACYNNEIALLDNLSMVQNWAWRRTRSSGILISEAEILFGAFSMNTIMLHDVSIFVSVIEVNFIYLRMPHLLLEDKKQASDHLNRKVQIPSEVCVLNNNTD